MKGRPNRPCLNKTRSGPTDSIHRWKWEIRGFTQVRIATKAAAARPRPIQGGDRRVTIRSRRHVVSRHGPATTPAVTPRTTTTIAAIGRRGTHNPRNTKATTAQSRPRRPSSNPTTPSSSCTTDGAIDRMSTLIFHFPYIVLIGLSLDRLVSSGRTRKKGEAKGLLSYREVPIRVCRSRTA